MRGISWTLVASSPKYRALSWATDELWKWRRLRNTEGLPGITMMGIRRRDRTAAAISTGVPPEFPVYRSRTDHECFIRNPIE